MLSANIVAYNKYLLIACIIHVAVVCFRLGAGLDPSAGDGKLSDFVSHHVCCDGPLQALQEPRVSAWIVCLCLNSLESQSDKIRTLYNTISY